MRVLLLTTVDPGDRRTGGEIVTSLFVEALRAAGHQVVVVGYRRHGDGLTHTAGFVDAGQRHIETSGAPLPVKVAWYAEAVRRRLPFSAAKYRSRRYLHRARRRLAEGADVLVIDHAQTGWAVAELEVDLPVVFLAHNVEHHLYNAQRAATRNPLKKLVHRREARLVRALELGLAAEADQVWALTAEDAAELAAASGRVRHFHVPGATATAVRGARTRDVAVLGTWTWGPNAEGLRWLCDEVVPRLDDVTVHVGGVGAEWCAEVPGVTYHGRVPDAAAFLASARVVAVPARSGSGVQVKTLDALGLGTWLVATPLALRGIEVGPGVAEVADDPVGFAAAISRLVADERTTGPNQAALAWARPRRQRFQDDVQDAVQAVFTGR